MRVPSKELREPTVFPTLYAGCDMIRACDRKREENYH